MIGILILLIAVTFGVLGKGEYRPPENEQEKADVPHTTKAPANYT
jgi:hypothetical protein